MAEKLEMQFPTAGWQQFLGARTAMLAAYDIARTQAKAHPVQTHHGNVGEKQVREWLSSFLPRRYGVTSGRILSLGIKDVEKLPHYDVIIYDKLESPVLWVEDGHGGQDKNQVLVIPVEHVRCVLEVKAAFSESKVRESVEHLAKLSPFLERIDAPSDPYKLHLPMDFCCGLIFFELRKTEETNVKALDEVVEGMKLRGFCGGLLLRSESNPPDHSGSVDCLLGDEPTNLVHPSSRLNTIAFGNPIEFKDKFAMGQVWWSEFAFAQFSFDLIARMQGKYQPGRMSSFYGIGASNFSKMGPKAQQ